MDYQEAASWFKALEQASPNPSLDNMKHLLEALGSPQENLKAVHIAGTNGKGSTSRFLSSMAIAAGLRTGTFNSPHILDYRELAAVDHEPISREAFAACTLDVAEACRRLQEKGLPHPTAFECLTALSLLHLSRENVDLAIIEAGMGGRDDATNVFDHPLLCIITTVAEDHKEFLGETLREIAANKAGIIKKNTPVVLAPNPLEVLEAVSAVMPEAGGKLYLMDPDTFKVRYFSRTFKKDVLSLATSHFEYPMVEKRLLGAHQTINLATALMAAQLLRKHFDLPKRALLAGARQAQWPCRCEVLSTKPLIVLDGAHNPDGAAALAAFLGDYAGSRPVRLVFGALKDKEVRAMLEALAPRCASLILTEPDSPRKLPIDSLEVLAEGLLPIDAKEPSPAAAMDKALSLHQGDCIVAAGSFYASMPIRRHLLENGFAQDL